MIAIIINAHKNEKQVQRLINRLNHKEIDIYIHADKKFVVNTFENAKMLRKRYDITWGDDSIINCIVDSLKEIHNKKYSHYILISGQDYPIVSSETIVKFLNKNKEKEFLQYKKIGNKKDEWNISDRYTSYRFNNRIINYISRKLWNKREILKGCPHYGGSLWWILTHNCIEYIISEYPKIKKRLKYTLCADEVMFQTIICNSNFKDNIINNNYRYIDWSDHIAGKNDGNPNTLTKKDYKRIIDSNNFFARKFDEKTDAEILDMLDKYIEKN